jgi:DNA polymerase III sliding clamp (beta) subunit (PCNA family)
VLDAIDGSDVALAQVQVEIAVDEVRLVTTDRYRLALRTLRCHDLEGDTAHAGVAAAHVQHLARPLLLVNTVELRIGAAGLTCIIDGEHHMLMGQQAAFPDYRTMLDHLTPGEAKLVADRGALLGFLRSTEAGSTVLVQGSEGRAALITGAHAVRFGTWIGPCLRAAFAVSHLEEALAISVGPDVIIELADGPRPAVIRSADHGSLTTLIMPQRTPGMPATDHEDQKYGPEQRDRPSLHAGYGGRTGGPAG